VRDCQGISGLRGLVGSELGPSEWLLVDQQTIDTFADLTRDRQWIHVERDRALAEGPYGSTVAHGFLTLSLLPYLLSTLRQVQGVRHGINFGLDRVRFPAPVLEGSRVRARATVTDVVDVGAGGVQVTTRVVIEAENAQKPSCIADQLTRYYF
jgi:acyl dehydratase